MLQFLADAGFLCDKAAMLRDTIKCTSCLTLILLMWRIWWAPNSASRWQMGF